MGNANMVVMLAGALMLLGGILQLPSILRLRGREPWRGAAVSAAALTVYGILALAGAVLNGTVRGTVLAWGIAAAVWFGLWLTRHDVAKRGNKAV